MEAREEFDVVWKEYNSSLETWKKSLENWQQCSTKAITKFNEACQKALETDVELLKKVSESWEGTLKDVGPEYMNQQIVMWENMFKESNMDSIKKFLGEWENFLKITGSDSFKAYDQALKKFTNLWKDISQKS